MEIRYKSITHERVEDAPFIGALISSIDCKFGCKGCINNHVNKEAVLTATGDQIIQQVLRNPFNTGIILGGLEWSLQPLELLELCRIAALEELQIMIYTGCDLNEFYSRLGKAVVTQTGYKEYVETAGMGSSETMYDVIGRMVLDNYIPEDYYIKTGRYDKTQKTIENNPFGVHLATANQKIFKIAKGVVNNVTV